MPFFCAVVMDKPLFSHQIFNAKTLALGIPHTFFEQYTGLCGNFLEI